VSSVPGPVFHLDDAVTWRGGQQQVLYLHQGLRALDVDSRVVCRRGSALHARLQGEGLPHYAFDHMAAHDLLAARTLARLVRLEGGLLHAHTSHAHDLALWSHRLGARCPIVVSRRVDFPVGRGIVSRRKYRSRRVTRYAAISSAVEHELVAGGVDAARIVRIPSGIDFTRFQDLETDHGWKRALGLDPGEILFGSVAALAPHKDQATLLEAFARFRAAGGEGRLVILGEGSLRDDLEAQRARLGLEDDVFLPGFVDDVLARLASFDVFVITSKTEGLGTSILDAMATGRPVIATRAGGIVDAVRHDETGLLADVGDVDALAGAMLTMQRSASLRQRYGHAGREAVTEFDVVNTVQRTLELYRELHESPTGP